MNKYLTSNSQVTGEFITLNNERFYVINNTNHMAPFFISLISNSDHWLFVSSTGGLTAGRVSPETALFPYVTVDKLHESTPHTGCKTLLRVTKNAQIVSWEPFNREEDKKYTVKCNLYKNTLGNKLCFEEINEDLELAFRYTWLTCEKYGFVRQCELINLSTQTITVDLVDGLQNILPAGTPRFTQTNSSNLVDAYKWNEVDQTTGLAFFTLYSGITDRAEPCESLKTNTVFCLGLDTPKILLSAEQLEDFALGKEIKHEARKRGIRGAYLVNTKQVLNANTTAQWQIIANVEQSQKQAVALHKNLSEPNKVLDSITQSIKKGSDELARIMGNADAFQLTNEENVSVHHYANVLFNILRGGAFDQQYKIDGNDFAKTIEHFNFTVFQKHQSFLTALPKYNDFNALLALVKQRNDNQLERLCYEYLPISFGRRHGDPSRPWNQFAIKLTDENNNRLLSYQGNWRDIFQNWEALTFSYPAFIENIIAKFVNASTMDGYNPYRITKEGIDWEVEEPDDPWSYIGYWGDHQIIYLQKMLELSNKFHPEKLNKLLHHSIFSYANVPYKIKSFDAMLDNAKNTVIYDNALADQIEQRVKELGADGKLVLAVNGEVYHVNLLEKLLVTLLCKLGNFVVDGGIWLNTQRPEWNDANNALVGQGLSMVTLYYVRRYITFFQQLIGNETTTVLLSNEVNLWLNDTAVALSSLSISLKEGANDKALDAEHRYQSLSALSKAACNYRQNIYKQEGFSGKTETPFSHIKNMLSNALTAIDHSIKANKREDGLYHAYNLLDLQKNSLNIEHLYPMLEGQVAALSSGFFTANQTVSVLDALSKSDIYRQDQQSYMLYPDRELPSFLEKNTIDAKYVESSALLQVMLKNKDERIIILDDDNTFRFNAELTNASVLLNQLNDLSEEYKAIPDPQPQLLAIYEQVFNHKAFTGRSGGMFGFEGLGCIYWHMVSKLLLVVEDSFFNAIDQGADAITIEQLGHHYYNIRAGIGFNKTPSEYGAFPCDPYSHTPKHAGAQQPGMTGQVKEEVLARFGELGLRVSNGELHFQTDLLRACEFLSKKNNFSYLDINEQWQKIDIGKGCLAFTYCQVPIIYQLNDNAPSQLEILFRDGSKQVLSSLILPTSSSNELFLRSGQIKQLTLTLTNTQLFSE
jgi:hypothetical protein